MLRLQAVLAIQQQAQLLEVEHGIFFTHVVLGRGLQFVEQRAAVACDDDSFPVEHALHVVVAKQQIVHGLEGNIALAVRLDDVDQVVRQVQRDGASVAVDVHALLQGEQAGSAGLLRGRFGIPGGHILRGRFGALGFGLKDFFRHLLSLGVELRHRGQHFHEIHRRDGFRLGHILGGDQDL